MVGTRRRKSEDRRQEAGEAVDETPVKTPAKAKKGKAAAKKTPAKAAAKKTPAKAAAAKTPAKSTSKVAAKGKAGKKAAATKVTAAAAAAAAAAAVATTAAATATPAGTKKTKKKPTKKAAAAEAAAAAEMAAAEPVDDAEARPVLAAFEPVDETEARPVLYPPGLPNAAKPAGVEFATDAGSRRNVLEKKPAEWGALTVGGHKRTKNYMSIDAVEEGKGKSINFSEAVGKDHITVVVGTQAAGYPVSGRWWKPVQAKRSSAVISKPKTNRKQAAWKARKGREKDMKDMLILQADLKNQSEQKKTEHRERSDARKKQREENEIKSQVVQHITNTRKLKKMNRKQLRAIEKR